MGKWVMIKMVSELVEIVLITFLLCQKLLTIGNSRDYQICSLFRDSESGWGIPTDEDLISILLYTYDIDLLAEIEIDLQQILDRLDNWCSCLKLKVECL